MNKIRLAERRKQLIAQAAVQRTTLAQCIEPWRVPLARVDQGLNLLRTIKRHPVWIVGGVVLFAALKPVRVLTWLRRGWVTWQVLHRLRGNR